MSRTPVLARRLLVPAAAVVVLAGVSTVSLAAVGGAFDSGGGVTVARSCTVPALPGTTVAVSLSDMGGGMMGGLRSPLRQGDWPMFRHGMMRLAATPSSAPHGVVSFTVTNLGRLVHELVVLPLPAGQAAGTRQPGADGTVDESGSLGEASSDCAAGGGDGISSGATGWLTVNLRPGRYELVCNQPGHYLAGMWAELDVS